MSLPAPRYLHPILIGSAIETHRIEVLLQRAVGLGVGQDAHIDDNIHIAGAGVLGRLRRTSSDQLTGRQPAAANHRFPTGAQAAAEHDEPTPTTLRRYGRREMWVREGQS